MELELRLSCVVQSVIVFPRRFQQRVRADDIGLDELAGSVDRTVHMGFGGEVHHVRRLELRKHAVELVLVADVDLLEPEPVGLRDWREVFQISGIGELVDYANRILGVIDDVPGYCRPDEPGSAGDDDAIHEISGNRLFAEYQNRYKYSHGCSDCTNSNPNSVKWKIL